MSLPVREIEIPPKEVYTYADYALLPEGAPYQLIGGKLVMTPAPTTHHQAISTRLLGEFLFFMAGKDLGMIYHAPIDVYFGEKETYQPDIIFIARDRFHIIEAAMINGAPDLVVEILSPSTGYYDLKKKARTYARHGVREYWVADPEDKSIEVYKGQEEKFTLNQRIEEEGQIKSLVLDGLEVEVRDVFVQI